VTITDLGNSLYRLAGERLRAVDQIRLEGNGQVVISPAYSALNSVDFAAKVKGKDLPKGQYAILAVIGTMTIPLQMEGPDKKLQPATITVAAPPEKAGASSTASKTTSGVCSLGGGSVSFQISQDPAGHDTQTKPASATIECNLTDTVLVRSQDGAPHGRPQHKPKPSP
jgi:hypothetical protein